MVKKMKLLGLLSTDTINKLSIARTSIGCQWMVFYLGMLMSMDSERTFLEMYVYINNALEIMEWSHLKPVSRPLSDSINIDGESPKLNYETAKCFHTGLGMVGWLNMTCRPDVSHAYSRLGQHQTNPTESAMDGLRHCYKYLIGSNNWGLSGSMHTPDRVLSNAIFADLGGVVNDQYGWQFFVDTD